MKKITIYNKNPLVKLPHIWAAGGWGLRGGSRSDGMGEKGIFLLFPSHNYFLLVLCATLHKQLVSTFSQTRSEELTFPLCIISVLFSCFFNGNFPLFKLKEWKKSRVKSLMLEIVLFEENEQILESVHLQYLCMSCWCVRNWTGWCNKRVGFMIQKQVY